MWSQRSEQVAGTRDRKFDVLRNDSSVSYREVLRLWQHQPAFRSFFIGLLRDAPFSAFRWETPAITSKLEDRPFEFVLLDEPSLARQPDPDAFADHFCSAGPNEGVITFANLGGDAILVVPRPEVEANSYGHLAAFVRQAPAQQVHELWAVVGKVMETQLGDAPLWLSTAGAGVSWLHVRIDRRPKYYGYGPYRSPR